MRSNQRSQLLLANGQQHQGFAFGAETVMSGEVVFNTAMTGYPESLSDPSYKGQILVLTTPMIGNYGVPEPRMINGIPEFFESEKIQISGLVITDYSPDYSHWNAWKSLDTWMKEHGIPGVYGVDTRELTKNIRDHGAVPGKIIPQGQPDVIPFHDPNDENLVDQVSIREVKTYGSGDIHIVLVDCGVKYNIIRHLLSRNTKITRVPWDYNYANLDFDGLFISNGPGNPALCLPAIEHIRISLQKDKPIFGICLGNQLMALAAGAETYKLPYGHRGHNQPVLMVGTDRAFITSQNHGFAIVEESIPADWEPMFVNLNDNTNEGIRHKTKPFFSAQFHPEASGGPTDTAFLFDDFIENIKRGIH
ncbi:MAG: glutamine-hydrolyzing carbamoyl-phosphate synthase small subunit [Bacteroidetes bacterium]|nr:glutamine-hydrolyzing carbamoyl-phosphate synthase small subunit [Bacteroidota bacterium]MBU1720413.1 glutamine-hydrolyzing carbamoyl-phosphate synthase small subunit [Bacteroidota bacterium]